ncbi:MAG: hypothetical protein IPM24_28470 [Bryobacterales bacterium]|nr:hypothetical protein [Bryobacterales bacterium]
MEDVNGDGYLDLVLHFNQVDTGIQSGATSACLYGETTGAVPVKGCDAVTTVP